MLHIVYSSLLSAIHHGWGFFWEEGLGLGLGLEKKYLEGGKLQQ